MVVLKRTLDIGIHGYPSPTIPKGPRSIRRRALRPKALQGGQICPFELLATVAGKLLEVSECSSASSSAAVGFDQHKICTKKEPLDVNKPFGGVRDDQGSSEGSAFSSGLQRDICKGKHEAAGEAIAEHVSSPFTNSGCSDKVNSDPKSTTPKSHVEFVKLSSIVEGDSPKYGEYNNTNIDNKANRQVDINKSPAATDFEEKVELPLFRDSNPNGSFLKQGDDVKLGCKDDDEIHLRYSIHNNNSNNTEKASRSPTHPGDARIRKFLSPKYWKAPPKLKDYEDSNTGGGVKNSYLNKRPCYDIDRSQRDTPFKKRKLFDRSSVVTQDGGFSCESVSNSPLKSVDNEKNGSAGKLHEGNRTTSSNFVSQKSCNLRNSNVRLSIKSFKVPELFIEVPETTTVASLKRTVSEAVTTILCGGLRVGVLLQGKKIRDDSRTLHQTGISRNDDINTIEFTLEPDTPTKTPPPPPICRKDPPPAPLSCDTPKFVNRCQINPKDDMFNFETRNKPTTTDSNSPSRSYGELVTSPTSELKDRKNCYDSKALVPVLGASMEALAVMPVSQRPKCSEMGQRRTRRPFSVSEVEALVHAVEKLGTGRWRDVKLCAFDNAKHRTYVDLKDKWKTLVHTARISPQQRRGEPVPQDLLDRVLAAQSYWSDHQAKQHGKHQHQAVVPRLFHSPTQKS